MERADAAEFVRNILWHLTFLRAQVRINQLLLTQVLANQTGKSAEHFEKLWAKEAKKMQRAMYLQALNEIKIPSGPEIDEEED